MMDKLIIEGGKRLFGKVFIGGAKNAALGILPAAILADEGICEIDNLPEIEDIKCYESILTSLGAEVSKDREGHLIIDSRGVKSHLAHSDEVRKMRASYYLLGAL